MVNTYVDDYSQITVNLICCNRVPGAYRLLMGARSAVKLSSLIRVYDDFLDRLVGPKQPKQLQGLLTVHVRRQVWAASLMLVFDVQWVPCWRWRFWRQGRPLLP